MRLLPAIQVLNVIKKPAVHSLDLNLTEGSHLLQSICTVARLHSRTKTPCRNAPSFFECFPYVCPDPVSVKKMILIIKVAQKTRFLTDPTLVSLQTSSVGTP